MASRKLTSRFVETITVPDGQDRMSIPDAGVEGLELRVSPNGAKTWAFRYRRASDGARRRVTIGRFPDKSLDDARQCAWELRAEVGKGADPAAEVQVIKAAPTFREMAADWQTHYAEYNRSPVVRKDDQSILNRFIFPVIGDMKAHDIGRRELAHMFNLARMAPDGRKRTNKPAPVRRLSHRPNRVFEVVRGIFRWALDQGILTNDPTHGMKRPVKKEEPRERELSPAEIHQFWKRLNDASMTQGLRIALRLSLATGQRIGEVVGIDKRELTLDGPAPVWVLPRGRTKNGEGTRVPLSPIAVELIREALALSGDRPWLFPSHLTDKAIEPGAATVGIKRAKELLGLGDFRTHDLRRTAATRMAEMGINPHTISLILNHISASKSTITGKVYVQYSFDREKREALNAWSERLRRIVAGQGESEVPLVTQAQLPQAVVPHLQ